MNKKRIKGPDGSDREGTVMPFRTGAEHWNEYLLDDGSVVRIKLVVTEVLKIDDLYDQNGDPVYLVNSTNVVAVSVPQNLRREDD